MTINDLFVGAIVTAYSKLDLPEERTPSHLRGMVAVSIAEEKPMDIDEFIPEN